MAHITLYFIALFSLATSASWAKLNQMPAEVLGFYRLFGASILLLCYMLLSGKLNTKFSAQPKKALVWSLASAFFFFLHLWSYKYASKHTLIANTMILFAINPLWTSFGSFAFFKDQISRRTLIAYFIALMGIFILIAGQIQMRTEYLYGDLSASASALVFAAYMLASKKSRTYMSNENFALIHYSGTAVLFFITCLLTQSPLTNYSVTSWWSVLGMVLIPTFLGHFLMTYLVPHMSLSKMTCGKLIEPVIGAVIAYFLFQEKIGLNTFIAFTLTAGSILILFWPDITNRHTKKIG